MSTNLQEQARKTEAGRIPRLGLLTVQLKVNLPDAEILRNLEHTKKLNLPKLRHAERNDRILYIAGSGPSLRNTWKLIPPDADVMALNGAYKFLRSEGLTPKYFSMVDARAVNTNLLENLSSETTYLIASQCHPSVFEALADYRTGVYHILTEATQQVFPDEELYVGGGGTIGLTALGIALSLGYEHIILLGYDSSFAGCERHVTHQVQNQLENVIDVWVEDRQYFTTPAMAGQVLDFFKVRDAILKIAPDFKVDVIGTGLFYDYVVTSNRPSTRERELTKYAEAYKLEGYHMNTARQEALREALSSLPKSSYLDISTGRGESLQIAKELGFSLAYGTETVDELIGGDVMKGILPNIPVLSKSYDVVSLIEVIEHLVEADIVPTLFELTRIARKHIIISAADFPSWMAGVDLHPSARPIEEWEALFREVWGEKVHRIHDFDISPAWRVDL